LALIKRTGVIDADKPISTQVRVLTLSEDSPYETLHSFISNAVAPFFKIQEKRESPEVLLTLDILKHGKRFHATVSFDTDTELDKIRQALIAIFTHLKKIRNTKYPIQRALRLVEAISRDLSSQLLKVLGTRKLMHVAYEEFEKTWEDEYEKLQVLLRDIVKRKREENLKMVWRLSPAHRKLQSRLDHMRRFRRQHEQLRAVIVRVLRPQVKDVHPSSINALMIAFRKMTTVPFKRFIKNSWIYSLSKTEIYPNLLYWVLNDEPFCLQVSAVPQHAAGEPVEPEDMKVAGVLFDAADANAIEEVNLAYENVKEVDGLDVSKEGMEAWEAAMKRYDERIDRVETRITARLRDQLGTAKNANEMFRIFSRFNALFVRPHIRGAIREYQTQLIQRVKDDIESLHDKFKVQYPQSQACKMSHVRDLPPVSGSIIWAKQIDRQLTAYMKRVEDVLGKGWENHVEGLKLKQDGDSFRAKLNTQEIFDDWARKVQQRNLGVSGRIFTIESTRARGRTGNMLKLKVNFLPEIITLSKEVRNLKWLSFRVPLAIVNKAHQANQLYPFAISLIESVRTYERTCEKVEERSSISLLVAGLKKEVQVLITEGITLVWESYKLDPYVQRLAETVFNFQEKVKMPPS
ncbi:Cytoplasmic dynein 1 heavy chain 1, partial [Xenoophorus captivus]